MVHSFAQEHTLYKPVRQHGSMLRRAHCCGTCLCLDLCHSWCVLWHRPINPFLLVAQTVYISACCAAARAHHGKKGRKPSPLPIYVSRPVISSPLIIHAGSFSENEREDNGMLTSFANVPLEDLGGTRG